jgi:hypothetical protein
MKPLPDPANKVAGLLHCHVCGRIVELKTADLRDYAQEGWPACCGEEMALFKPDDGLYWNGGPA